MPRTIYLAGDSTCANNDMTTYPCTGWGQMLHRYVGSRYQIKNYAKNGRSSKSFINEGWLEEIEKNMEPGDYLLIQFGHNDSKDDVERHTEPFTTYQRYLKIYIDTARKKGVTPILITPLFRRYFDDEGRVKTVKEVHGEYPSAVIELAIKERVSVIDLCQISRKWLMRIGDEKSKKYFMNLKYGEFDNYPDGLVDNTHLVVAGGKKIAEIIGKELGKYNI